MLKFVTCALLYSGICPQLAAYIQAQDAKLPFVRRTPYLYMNKGNAHVTTCTASTFMPDIAQPLSVFRPIFIVLLCQHKCKHISQQTVQSGYNTN